MFWIFDPSLVSFFIAVWLVGLVALMWETIRKRCNAFTLVFAALLSINYLPAGMLLWVDSYEYTPKNWNYTGLVLSTAAFVALLAGHLAMAFALRSQSRWCDQAFDGASHFASAQPKAIRSVAVIGLLLSACVVVFPGLLGLPGLRGIVAAFYNFLVPSYCLFAIAVFREQGRLPLSFYLYPIAFMLLTVASSGYLGIGASFAIGSFAMLCGQRLMPRKMLLFLPVAIFLGLSLYINYMRERGDIRQQVWGGATFERRVDSTLNIFNGFEFFDSNNHQHLRTVDERLNQNFLLGALAERLDRNQVELLGGESIKLALVAWIPRVLWPEKPVVAGGGSYVADGTGLDFDKDTSVGMWLIFEMIYNYGVYPMVGFFLFLGAFLRWLDFKAQQHLAGGRFTRWLSLCAVGYAFASSSAAFSELAGTLAALVFASLFLKLAVNRWTGKDL